MKTRIYFSTWYDDTDTICGYVYATDCGDWYKIKKTQYDRALKKRTIGGTAGIKWHSDGKPVYVKDVD